MMGSESVVIKELRSGERFVCLKTMKPYIKCDHVVTLTNLSTLHTGVGLYDGALTVFHDDEELLRSEVTLHTKEKEVYVC